MNATKDYFLGTHDAETQRLEFQSNTWKPQTKNLWDKMGIRKGSKVLDLGCGPGYCTFDLAEIVGPEGKVVAADKSVKFLDILQNKIAAESVHHIQLLELDVASQSIPETDFDFIFVRWLHQYVDHLQDVVASEIRALKSGGKIGALEVYHYQGVALSPQSAIFNHITDQLIKFYASNSRNVNAGGNLPHLYRQNGMDIEYLANASPLAFQTDIHWEWYRQFSFSMLPRLVEAKLISDGEKAAYEKEMYAYAELPGAFLSVPAHVAVVAVKR